MKNKIDPLQFNSIVDEYFEAFKTMNTLKTKPLNTQAEVVRVEGDTVWVHIPGGEPETPMVKNTDCKAGDIVQIQTNKAGRGWLVGNITSPPTDDTKAKEADMNAGKAMNKAKKAEAIAEEGLKEAQSTSNYFWYVDGTGSESGAHITEVPQAEFQSNPSGGNLLMRSNVVKIRRALTTLAQFDTVSVKFYGGGSVVAEFGSTGAYLYHRTTGEAYKFMRILTSGMECGQYAYNSQTQSYEETYSARLGGDDSFLYARKPVMQTGGEVLYYFASPKLDKDGFHIIHDKGLAPFEDEDYYCDPTHLTDDGLQLGYTGAGSTILSKTVLKAPVDGERMLYVRDEDNSITLAEVTYNNGSLDTELNGDLMIGGLNATSISSSGKVTAGALDNGVFALETHQILASQAIAGGAHIYDEVTFTKPGYYPLCIAGYNAPNAVFVPSRLRLKDMTVGSTVVAYDICNPRSSSGTSNFNVDILWLKITA